MKKTISKNQIDELIKINEIKSKTITDLIKHENTAQEDMDKLLACRRFIKSFILELQNL
jgi:hypothetical protein